MIPDRSKTINRRDRTVEQAALPRTAGGVEAGVAEVRVTRLDVQVRSHRRGAKFVVEGDGAYHGIRGFFRWLERKKYKVHVRVFLSRYRGYLACPDCGGARLRREARDVRVGSRTIDSASALTVRRGAAVLH